MNPHSDRADDRPEPRKTEDVKLTYEHHTAGVKKGQYGEWVALIFWHEGAQYRVPRSMWKLLFNAEKNHDLASNMLEMPEAVLRVLLNVVKLNVGN